MKKILMGLFFCGCFLLSGCGKQSSSDVIKEFAKKVEKSNSYYIEGTMEIINNEDTYTYDVTIAYKADDYYKVVLNNTLNNHEQVILRNTDGVYVVTPSLNKSFKFQSDWPYNNSQVYLLKSLLDDINNTENSEFKEIDNGYTITTNVNYPNNKKLVKQIITFNKNIDPAKVEVIDENNDTHIRMTFTKIDLKSEFKNDYFNLDKITTSEENIKSEETKTTSNINDVIYPMYLPTNTYLTNQETINSEDGQRLILTFDGDSSFTLIEETVSYQEEHQIVPTFGEVELLTDAVGAVSENSVTWISNGIEYYIASDVMATSDLLDVARSINVIPVASLK